MSDYVGTTRATYDAIAAQYAHRWSAPSAWVNAELNRLVAALPSDARVADIGCGPRHHTLLLRNCGFRAVGFDLSRQMLTCGGVPGQFSRVLRPGGLLSLSVVEGDGEGWEPVSYAQTYRRCYVFHRIEPLIQQLTLAGFDVLSYSRRSTHRNWLHLSAQRG